MRFSKQHIVEEIRRTAAQNGGLALGVAAFYNETGIKTSDWEGRHWARWSDALAEAGLTPPEWQGKYPDDQILESLARLARDTSRFPVNREMELRRRADPSFPSVRVFRRFGGRAGLVSALRDFCTRHPEYADVSAYCAAPSAARESVAKAPPDLGEVYLLRSGRHYKIGRTNASGRRERELAIQLPERAKLVHSIRTDDPIGIEAYWHRRFDAARKNGEWFELTAEDVAAFRRRKFM